MNKGMNDHLLKIAVVVQIMFVFCIAAFFFIVGFISGATLRSWNDVKTINLDQLEYSQVDTWKQHLEIYAAATTIKIGVDVDFLINKLKRLEYQEVPEKNSERLEEGQYTFSVEKDGDIKKLFLYLQGFHYPRAAKPSYIVNITLNNRRIATIRKENGVYLNNFDLAPELMSEIYDKGGAAREIVTLTEIPETLIQAFLAVEDKRFYEHWGVDVRRVFGSLLHNIRNLGRGSLQGASTITQQLSKNIYLSPHQRYIRKIKEALLAVRIETRFSKDEIMERYLNFINLGRYGSRDLLGVQEAAKSYFGKMVSELNIHECATLAGIPKSPPRYSPIRNPENCKTRRNLVIRLMREENFISDRQYQTSIAKPVDVEKSQSKQIRGSSHFLDYIHEQLKNIPLLAGQLYNNGLKVYTTIDLSMQQIAETAVADHLRELDKGYKDLPNYDENKISDSGINPIESYLQAALIAIEPKTGYIKAMVGGRDYYITRQKVNFFNRAVQAQRQPGSAFKPIVFAAMFQEPPLATPAT
ncbi:MAG: transglycosylase domain-containing protein, partial [Candidatus Poribacteria bacterium]|nr:transglycosylase domain-containing protein [Candidatus Poribacteria bacterium]